MPPVDVEMNMFENPTSSLVPYHHDNEQEKDSPIRCCVAALVMALFVPVVVIVLLVLKLVQLNEEQ